jgi:hypothetical protein
MGPIYQRAYFSRLLQPLKQPLQRMTDHGLIPAVLQKDELYTLHIVGHIDSKWRHNHRRVGEAKKLPSLSL